MSQEITPRIDPPDVAQDPLSAALLPFGQFFGMAFLLITAFSFFEVVMRYGFNAPTEWVHETSTAMTAVCFVFGGVYCLATDRHIRVVLIYDFVSPRVRRIMDIVISIVGTAATGLMAWASWPLAYKSFFRPTGEFRLETTGTAWNPPTPAIVKTFLFLMLCVMCVQFALQTIRHIRRDPLSDPAGHDPLKVQTGDA